jgi:hypothetical protein
MFILFVLLLFFLSEADEVYLQCDPGLSLALSFKLKADQTNKLFIFLKFSLLLVLCCFCYY